MTSVRPRAACRSEDTAQLARHVTTRSVDYDDGYDDVDHTRCGPLTRVGRGYCSPRKTVKLDAVSARDSGNEGSESMATTWRRGEQRLPGPSSRARRGGGGGRRVHAVPRAARRLPTGADMKTKTGVRLGCTARARVFPLGLRMGTRASATSGGDDDAGGGASGDDRADVLRVLVRPAKYCPSRHTTHLEPSFLQEHGILLM